MTPVQKKPTTHASLVSFSSELESMATHVLELIGDDTEPLWRNRLERLHEALMSGVVAVDDVVDILPPALGGNPHDPWLEPLGCGVSSLEALTVFEAAHRHNINIRTFRFNDLRELVRKANGDLLW